MSTVKRIETRQIKQFQRKRVAAYARVSVDTEQLMHSLSAQVICRASFFVLGKLEIVCFDKSFNKIICFSQMR